ncbi:MAG TPA: hypothetical protein VJ648_03650 [Vicinamibacteria bacterium]|nr:hypothetical protein [Vicinamibacteria bacterium]
MRRTALSNFYREEFLRHIEYLQIQGILDENNREVADRCRAFCARLDELCCLEHFPELAASVLQSFEALSRLSDRDPRLSH